MTCIILQLPHSYILEATTSVPFAFATQIKHCPLANQPNKTLDFLSKYKKIFHFYVIGMDLVILYTFVSLGGTTCNIHILERHLWGTQLRDMIWC